MAKAKKDSGNVLVIVESPTKAKTIKKFLGRQFKVHSCMGHVRDLPQSAKDIPEKYKKFEWSKLGVNVDEDFDPLYCIPKNKVKVVDQLKNLLKDADELILATDEDREGESISWHLLETLKPKIPVKRMVFHEITKEAIEDSLEHTRKIDENLVRAQEARRILDRLVGYTISPLLWKKVAFGLSAGRVQSVAVKIICDRELERMKFRKAEYWSVNAENKKSSQSFESRLLEFKGQRIAVGKDFDPNSGQVRSDREKILHLGEKQAKELAKNLKSETWTVVEVEEKPVTRRPAPPFITSTLQQEANRKLGWGSNQTMRVAQSLYEQGYITYMRTDSTNLSNQALDAARAAIKDLYGKDYLAPAPRTFASKKVKGAQEAHEAIRPAGTHFVHPDEAQVKSDESKLYDLIWKRTVASQMADSKQKQVSVRLKAGEGVFAASGTTIEFPGFLRAYVEGHDDPEAALEERESPIPPMKVGDKVDCTALNAQSHETSPPARFTEASLIQTMEKEGIGRPSTYAATISTIIARGYVQKTGNALVPTFTALVVDRLLEEYLPQYVDVGFTSKMEESLDEIASGDLDSTSYLKSVYLGKEGLKKQVEGREKEIKPEKAREIHLDNLKGLVVRVGKFGAYVCRKEGKKGEEVCATLPDSSAPADVTFDVANGLIDQKIKGVDALGKDPTSGEKIYVLSGRFGPYVQRGESENPESVKRMAIPPQLKMEDVTLDKALALLELPKKLGAHPVSKKDIKVGYGRFGPYVVHEGDYRSIPRSEDFFAVDLKRALELFAKPKLGRGKSAPIKDLGKHPSDGEPVGVFVGKYGPYVKWGKVNKSLSEGVKPEDMTLEKALELFGDEKGGGKKRGGKSGRARGGAEGKMPPAEEAAEGSGSRRSQNKGGFGKKPSPMTKNVVARGARKKKGRNSNVAKSN